jgi:alkylation response protein AidB-like acyl-CoA dehydrogenase
LPEFVSGRALGAFALTEPQAGSDISAIATKATRLRGGWLLDGEKCWISFGQIATVFLVFARSDRGISSYLVRRECKGLSVEPMEALLGLRGSMLGRVRLNDCFVEDDCLVGAEGRGHPSITTSALTLGRLGVAAGCVGIIQACADANFQYTRNKYRGGERLSAQQLIAAMLSSIYIDLDAARLLCLQAAVLLDERDPRAVTEVAIAKQFSATAAMRAAQASVQIHGAVGCSSAYPVERHYRDAKIMEIIEGTSELQQLIIGGHGYSEIPSFIRAHPGKPEERTDVVESIASSERGVFGRSR